MRKDWWKYGPRCTKEQRVMRHVEVAPNGCWNWTGGIGTKGYGKTSWMGKTLLAHRLSYEVLRSPIPEGMQLDHKCRNRRCVNPDHLEPVTCQENLLRGDTFNARNAAKVRCKRDHEFTPENTYTYQGMRHCLQCRTLRKREWRKKRAAA